MGHNLPQKEGLYPQKIWKVKINTLIKGPKKTLLDHNIPIYLHNFLIKTSLLREKDYQYVSHLEIKPHPKYV
jgi:hypothetical protein